MTREGSKIIPTYKDTERMTFHSQYSKIHKHQSATAQQDRVNFRNKTTRMLSLFGEHP
jgi:hypothetical protein